MKRREKVRIEPMAAPQRVINYWLRDKGVAIAIILSGVTFNTAVVLGPIMQGKMLDAVLAGLPLSGVLRAVGAFVGVVLLIQGARLLKRFYVRRFANNTGAVMRLMVYNHVVNLDIETMKQQNAGHLMTGIISDVDLCVEGMRKATTEVFDTGVLMISYFVAMMLYDGQLTALACLFTPLAVCIARGLKGIVYRTTAAWRRASSELAGFSYASIEHTLLYRIHGLDEKNRRDYAALLQDYQDRAIRAGVAANALEPVYKTVALLGVALVVVMGGGNVLDQSWTVGEFSAYMTMFAALAVKAGKTAKLFNALQAARISWQRVRPWLGAYIKPERRAAARSLATTLEVEELSFTWPGAEEEVVRQVSFCAQAGQIIGITGPVAGGKSSLGLALTGLWPYRGSIRIDRRELRDIPADETSSIIAYLGHDPQLLSATIADNICLGRPGEVAAALAEVAFGPDLAAMPRGEATMVGSGGVRLSGGQQARLALARTLLDHHKIIILDDPLAAVDMATEALILEHLRLSYRDSLILLISHRLAIFPRVDNILLLHSDKTWEYGSHRQLMERSELYAAIYQLQGGAEYEG